MGPLAQWWNWALVTETNRQMLRAFPMLGIRKECDKKRGHAREGPLQNPLMHRPYW